MLTSETMTKATCSCSIRLVLALFTACLLNFSHSYLFKCTKLCPVVRKEHISDVTPRVRSLATALYADNDGDDYDEPTAPKRRKRRSKFDRVVDDFIGKKYGAGEAFYGRRTADMTDEEFDKANGVVVLDEDELERAPLQGNAILIVGEPESDITQWIAFELLEKGFSVRIACSTLKSGVKAFGKPGVNVDMCLINPTSSEKSIARCIESVQAIIITTNFVPPFNPFVSTQQKVNEGFLAAKRVLDLVTKAQQANVNDIAKVLYISRYVEPDTHENVPEPSLLDGFSAFFFAQTEINALKYRDFCQKHKDFETIVRDCGAEYVIIRAPPVLYPLRPGARDDMYVHSAVKTQQNSSIRRGSGWIAELDFAEAVVNSLLLEEVSQVTFTVSGRAKGSVDAKLPRIPRNAYYEILTLDAATDVKTDDASNTKEDERNALYSEIKANYAMRNMDTFKSQLEEDAALEEYWRVLLKDLPKDPKLYV